MSCFYLAISDYLDGYISKSLILVLGLCAMLLILILDFGPVCFMGYVKWCMLHFSKEKEMK